MSALSFSRRDALRCMLGGGLLAGVADFPLRASPAQA